MKECTRHRVSLWVRGGRIRQSFVKKLQGFTLLETLIAITILLLAITGPLTIAARGLDTALVASDQITASYLAQDAIEYVRWARDTNTLSCVGPNCSTQWLTGIKNLQNCISGDGSKKCEFDATRDAQIDPPQLCVGGNCNPMKFDSDPACVGAFLNTYNYLCGLPSKFTRTVSIQTPLSGNDKEALVTAQVSWQDGNVVHTVKLVDDLFEWQI